MTALALLRHLSLAEGARLAAVRSGRAGVERHRDGCSRLLDAAVAAVGAGLAPVDDETAARLLVGLRDLVVRDLAAVYAGTEQASAAEDLCRDLAERAPQEYAAAPACLLGLYAWYRGDTPAAREGLERSLAAAPDYRFAHLLILALAARIPVDSWHSLMLGRTLEQRRADIRAAGASSSRSRRTPPAPAGSPRAGRRRAG